MALASKQYRRLLRSVKTRVTTISSQKSVSIAVFLVAGMVGTLLLSASHAATPASVLDTENGTVSSCARKVMDTTASSGVAVRFNGCTINLSDPTDLDENGAMVPDTNYAIPAGAIFMATTGNDANTGTQASPVKTLNKAISLAPASGTIVFRAGTYRDWYSTTGTGPSTLAKSLTLQAYPHEQVWFDGTDVIATNQWTSDGQGHWYLPWSTPSFCAGNYYKYAYNNQSGSTQNPGDGNTGPCSWYDTYADPGYTAASDPQMIFKDGTAVHEVDSLSNVDASDFYYQEDLTNQTGRMYIGFDPTGHTTELASRPMAMIVGASNVTVRGIGFKRYATNTFSNNTRAAIFIGATNATIENDVFKQMAGGGLTGGGNNANGIVHHSIFVDNGYDGFGWNGHQHTSGTDDNLLVDGNVFNRNNTEHFDTHCSASCGASNIKLAHMDGFVFKNNIVENAFGHAGGVWCDLACSHGVYVNNLVRNNARFGIFHEVSDTGLIASNLVLNNGSGGDYGIRVGSSNTKVYNNTVVTNSVTAFGSLWVYDDNRSYGYNNWTDVGPDTRNTEVANNIFADTQNSNTMVRVQGTDTTNTNTVPSQFYSLSDYNAFWRSVSTQNLFRWIPPGGEVDYKSLSSLTTGTGLEAHSSEVSGGNDPFFVDMTAGNYQVRSNSTAYHSSTALPDDVANAIGVTQKTGQNQGAINWPGQ